MKRNNLLPIVRHLWGLLPQLLLACSLCLLGTACSDSSVEETPPTPPQDEILFTGDAAPVIGSEGGELTLEFQTNTAWKAQVQQPWCTVSPIEGPKGQSKVNVTVAPNETTDERNTAIVLKAGTARKEILLTQKGQHALTVTADRLTVPAAGGTATVEVKANVAYTYTLDEASQSWISLPSNRALQTSQIILQVKPNEDPLPREGKLTLEGGGLTQTVTLYQEGSQPTLLLSQTSYEVSSEATEIVLEVKANIEFQVHMPDAEWLTRPESRAFSTYTVRVAVAANETYDSRKAEIRLVSPELPEETIVTVFQAQKDAILVAQPCYLIPAEANTLTFDIQTNVSEFDIQVEGDWLHHIPSSRALRPVTLNFQADAHTGEAERKTTITLSQGEVIQTIQVVQEGYLPWNQVSIVHTATSFVIPTFLGTRLQDDGTIRWGDSQETSYAPNRSHTYTDGKGEHQVFIETRGAEEIVFSTLENIESIDVSHF